MANLSNIPLIKLSMDGVELGKYLGKAFSVNIITVTDIGSADIERIKHGNNR